MGKFKQYYKSIFAFWAALAVFAGSILALGIPFPSSVVAVLSVVAASGVIAGVVAGAPANKLTPQQILKQAPAIGIAVGTTVANATIDHVSQAIQTYITEGSKRMALPNKTIVQDLAAGAPAVVATVANDVVDKILADFTAKVKR